MEENFRRVPPPPPPPRPQNVAQVNQNQQVRQEQVQISQAEPKPSKVKKGLSPILVRALTIMGAVISFGLCALFAYMLLS